MPSVYRQAPDLEGNDIDYNSSSLLGGGNYQTLINEALREYIRRGGIEAAVRRAVREELRGAGVKQAAGG